jgi:hypothetical protein
MSATVQDLLKLRHQVLGDYVDGRITQAVNRADLAAIASELDRLLSPGGRRAIDRRAAMVVAEILADDSARASAVPPAQTARLDYWHRRRVERLRREDPDAHETEVTADAAPVEAEPDEVRMARPILAALRDRSIAGDAKARVQAIARRPPAEVDPTDVPESTDVTWADRDRLSWEEFRDGVPCQGCGRPFLGDETSQRDSEAWPAYRERMAPIEAAFKSRHPDHGTSWTVGGGPAHCRRCCAPHPLWPQQIEAIARIWNPPTPAPVKAVPARRCGTCRQPIEGAHVCQIDDLPKALRAVVEAILMQERRKSAVET